MLNLVNTQNGVPNENAISNSYLTPLLSKPEVKVGDSINVPLPPINPSVGVTGDLTLTFRGFENITVPAGTYKVFRVDITSNDLSMDYNPSISTSRNLAATMNMDLHYQIYIEYGTMRQIKSAMQQTVSFESEMIQYAMQLDMEMILSQHIKP
jgi:hypothetical protein